MDTFTQRLEEVILLLVLRLPLSSVKPTDLVCITKFAKSYKPLNGKLIHFLHPDCCDVKIVLHKCSTIKTSTFTTYGDH